MAHLIPVSRPVAAYTLPKLPWPIFSPTWNTALVHSLQNRGKTALYNVHEAPYNGKSEFYSPLVSDYPHPSNDQEVVLNPYLIIQQNFFPKMNTQTHARMHTHKNTCIVQCHTHTHTRTHAYTHTHTHTHTYHPQPSLVLANSELALV
jgi:hypothetical protein